MKKEVELSHRVLADATIDNKDKRNNKDRENREEIVEEVMVEKEARWKSIDIDLEDVTWKETHKIQLNKEIEKELVIKTRYNKTVIYWTIKESFEEVEMNCNEYKKYFKKDELVVVFHGLSNKLGRRDVIEKLLIKYDLEL